jgi:hypothetical protein
MQFVLIGKDKGDGQLRLKARAEHLEHVSRHQRLIVYAGPLIDGGRMVGSVFIFDLPDRVALDRYLAGDPYFRDAIFETVEIYESRWMVPEREPGFLAAEAERARQAAG